MKRLSSSLAIISLFMLLLATVPASAQTPDGDTDAAFAATLTGAEEVPIVVTDGQGTASFDYDAAAGEVHFQITTHGLEDVTQAHIHLAPEGENGPVVVTLFGFVDGGVTRDGILSEGTFTEANISANADLGFDGTLGSLMEALRTGGAYVNVHTVQNPPGEIRGQIIDLSADQPFTDVGGNFHADSIRLIAAAGITQGRTATTYGPDDPVRRRQMALFLSRAFNLPPADDDYFGDDDGAEYEEAANALAAAGISLGCTEGLFCPHDQVTRGQMASFLARALALAEGKTDIDEQYFNDGDRTHGTNITLLAAAGITTGVTETSYQPERAVQRDQMATFLARSRQLVARQVPVDFELTVLHNNDGESALVGEGDVGGVARFAQVVEEQRDAATERGSGALMLSSGDNFLAGPAFTASQEQGVYYDAVALNAIGYDAVAIGNHDFDFGPDVLAEFIAEFDTPPPYLSANLDFSDEPTLQALVDAGVIAPNTVVTVGGQEIGVVGATTPALRSISSPREVEVNSDVAGEVQAEIDALTDAGVEVIVLISHLQSVNEDLSLAPNLSNVDIMIAGGGDELLASEGDPLIDRGDDAEAEEPFGPYPLTAINRDGDQVPVVTTQGQYTYLGQLVTSFNALGDLVAVDDELSRPIPVQGQDQDAALLETVEGPVADFEAELAEQVIATSEVDLNGLREDVRTRETNLGNLVADAILWQARELNDDFGAPEPDVAMTNGGGIRNTEIIPAGDVTELHTFQTLPFANFPVIVPDVSRTTFKALLENAVSNVENVDGRFAQIAGFEFTWDASEPARTVDEEGEVTAEGSRIQSVALADGTEIVADGEVVEGPALVVATNDFSARGGDDWPFDDPQITALGLSLQQAFANYLTAAESEGGLGGEITEDAYPEGGEGRITRQN